MISHFQNYFIMHTVCVKRRSCRSIISGMKSALVLLALLFCNIAFAFTPLTSQSGVPLTWNKKFAEGGWIRWRLASDSQDLHDMVTYAVHEWTTASYGTIRFMEVDKDEDLLIGYDEYMFYYAGYANLYLIGESDIDSATIVINPLYKDSSIVNPYAVMLHEFGHVLGLSHPDVTTIVEFDLYDPPTMWPIVYHTAVVLHADDIAGIQFLYPSKLFDISNPYPVGKPKITVTSKQGLLIKRRMLVFETDYKGAVTWKFGDGTSLAVASPKKAKHRYVFEGMKVVVLMADDKVISTKVIEVLDRRPRRRR